MLTPIPCPKTTVLTNMKFHSLSQDFPIYINETHCKSHSKLSIAAWQLRHKGKINYSWTDGCIKIRTTYNRVVSIPSMGDLEISHIWVQRSWLSVPKQWATFQISGVDLYLESAECENGRFRKVIETVIMQLNLSLEISDFHLPCIHVLNST